MGIGMRRGFAGRLPEFWDPSVCRFLCIKIQVALKAASFARREAISESFSAKIESFSAIRASNSAICMLGRMIIGFVMRCTSL